jgi:hypothetical protein
MLLTGYPNWANSLVTETSRLILDANSRTSEPVPNHFLYHLQLYLAYATKTRVAGLMKLPLTGDPIRAMGLIAQPGEVTCLAVGYDGETLVTAGGSDG